MYIISPVTLVAKQIPDSSTRLPRSDTSWYHRRPTKHVPFVGVPRSSWPDSGFRSLIWPWNCRIINADGLIRWILGSVNLYIICLLQLPPSRPHPQNGHVSGYSCVSGCCFVSCASRWLRSTNDSEHPLRHLNNPRL
jgi:hypothetical protein